MQHAERCLDHFLGMRPQGHGYIVCCPGYDDADAVLDISIQDDGHVRFDCRSGDSSPISIVPAADSCQARAVVREA